jgi:hypothetical protein
MGDLRITLPSGVEVTFMQALRIHELGEKLGEYEWHLNDCGCCVTVHPRGNHHAGYVIGSEGDYDWHEIAH